MLAQEAAEKERLISDLTHDYKEQKEKLQSLDKEITENRSKILSQKQESTALGAQLDWMNHSITTQAQTLPQQDPYSDFEDFFGGFFGW